ncbi:MAG: RsmE family RNA methyltransferase [Clostridia bacterium]|nr:RsmE family RNA methyltransferase [Clostridia bacterium]
MNRFFTEDITGDTARITGEDVKHIRKVLRLKQGDLVSVCDGRGTDWLGTIASVSESEVTLTLSDEHPAPTESPIRVTLFQGIPKTGKTENIVQKCTELGVAAVVPVTFARCVAVPKGDYEKKLVRYRRVAFEAAKQSRRGRIPKVLPPVSPDNIPVNDFDTVLVAYEDEHGVTLKNALRSGNPGTRIALVIGPEGGLEESEVGMLKAKGAVPVSLGARILRTETAGPAMLASVLYELE